MLKIRVINLADAVLRRQYAESQLRHLGLPFEFFEALGPEQGVNAFDCLCENKFVLNTGREILPTEIACFASHRLLWKQCRDNKLPMMIMEDDFRLDRRFHLAAAMASRLIDEFGLLRLQDETRARRVHVVDVDGFDVWRYTKPPQSTMCYAINPLVAERLIEASKACCEPVDVFMRRSWQYHCPMYGLLPYTVCEAEIASDSNIGERRKARKSAGLRLMRFGKKAYCLLRQTQFNLAQSDRSKVSAVNHGIEIA